MILGTSLRIFPDYSAAFIEILNIIKDHYLVNFDIIRRRFLAVNERTLRYDLKKLQEKGFIHKRGTTKGAYYEVNKP